MKLARAAVLSAAALLGVIVWAALGRYGHDGDESIAQFMMSGDVYEVPMTYRPVLLSESGGVMKPAPALDRTKLDYNFVRRKLERRKARVVIFHNPEKLIAPGGRFAELVDATDLSFSSGEWNGELPVGKPMYVYEGYNRIDFPGVTYLASRLEGPISTRRIVALCAGSPPDRGTPLHSCRATARTSTGELITLYMSDELTLRGWAPVFDAAEGFLTAHRVSSTG